LGHDTSTAPLSAFHTPVIAVGASGGRPQARDCRGITVLGSGTV
jgi:hypothetical protein